VQKARALVNRHAATATELAPVIREMQRLDVNQNNAAKSGSVNQAVNP